MESENWNYAIRKFQEENPLEYKLWLSKSKFISEDNKEIKIAVDNQIIKDKIENKYKSRLLNYFHDIGFDNKILTFIIENSIVNSKNDNKSNEIKNNVKNNKDEHEINLKENNRLIENHNNTQYTKKKGLSERFKFDNYIKGRSNHIAVSAARYISENPGSFYNPLFIYGGVGVGKTHLMQAIGYEVLKNFPNFNIQYVTSEFMMNDFVNAMKNNTIYDFRMKYRAMDLLLIDDIQFFEQWGKTQEEFFNTYNKLKNDGKQMVFTSDRPPHELTKISDRLISRLKSGLVAYIEPPDLELRKSVIKHLSKKLSLRLRKEIEEYLFNNFTENIRDIESALHKLKFTSEIMNRNDFDINEIESILADLVSPCKKTMIEIKDIQRTVSEYYSIQQDDMKSKKRTSKITKARQIAMYLSRQYTELSTTDIGSKFGGKNHSTVLQSVKKIERELIGSPALKTVIQELKSRILCL